MTDVEVVPLTSRLLARWCEEVQPIIDANYVHCSSPNPSPKVRADVHWNWAKICRDAYLHNYTGLFGFSRHGPAIALAIVVGDDPDDPFPIGMLTTVPQFYCHVAGDTRERAFTWYLADAPAEVYPDLLESAEVRGVARMLLDTSIQVALDLHLDPAHLLHADPNGGAHLTDFYVRCNMRQLTDQCGPITPYWRAKRSNEYFQFNSAEALDFCAKFEGLR